MRVGVISDTHNPSVGDEPPAEIIPAFEGVDVIIHAGDIYQPSCLDWLEKIAPVYAVELGAGAHFQEDPRVVDMSRVLELEGHTIGLIHDLMLPGMAQEVTEYTPLSKHFPVGANLVGEHRRTVGHRFKKHQSKGLIPGEQCEQICFCIPFG